MTIAERNRIAENHIDVLDRTIRTALSRASWNIPPWIQYSDLYGDAAIRFLVAIESYRSNRGPLRGWLVFKVRGAIRDCVRILTGSRCGSRFWRVELSHNLRDRHFRWSRVDARIDAEKRVRIAGGPEALTMLRAFSGYSQREIGAAFNLSHSFVSYVESRKKRHAEMEAWAMRTLDQDMAASEVPDGRSTKSAECVSCGDGNDAREDRSQKVDREATTTGRQLFRMGA